jgi:peptide-methionine (R)-S-oxide reductase
VSDKIKKTEQEWREQLTAEQYRVLREHGTERAFTGAHHANKAAGRYRCAACGADLFSSEHKYDSGSGWPSFVAPLSETSVETETDQSYGMIRTEVHCARCDSHLGHVFPDGPGPDGLRYCINSVSLEFEEKSEG